MKKTILVAGLTLLLATTPAMAQMMGGQQWGQGTQSTQQMMEQQQTEPQQSTPYGMYPSMMGGYGYGMGPGMMGGYGGYGMGPGNDGILLAGTIWKTV